MARRKKGGYGRDTDNRISIRSFRFSMRTWSYLFLFTVGGMIRVIDGPCFTPRLCPRSRSCLCTCPLPCIRQRLMAEGRRTNDQRSGSVIHVTILYPAIHIDIRYLLSVVASFLFFISVARRNFLIFYFVRFLHPVFLSGSLCLRWWT